MHTYMHAYIYIYIYTCIDIQIYIVRGRVIYEYPVSSILSRRVGVHVWLHDTAPSGLIYL